MSQLVKAKIELAKRHKLEPWKLELLDYAMLPKALRPNYQFIMAKFGIGKDTYYNTLRSKPFNDARRELVREFYKDDIPDVLMAMKNEALAGNERAARLFLEYVDEWSKDPRSAEADETSKINIQEAKQIIINLQQKFYGDKKEPAKIIDAEVTEELEQN